ncbi:MAG TPA: hypothetical protein VF491_05390 [Vicinamibacterales bacterium]
MNLFFDSAPWTAPGVGPAVADAMRIGCGLLMLLTLIRLVPDARRYFLSERWGGYGERGWRVDLIQNPVVMPVTMAAWMAACVAMIAGWYPTIAATVNLACCYYFFIAMRWRGVLRGLGAPGFIATWLGAAVFLIDLSRRHIPELQGLAIFVLQIDFALIMLAAGIYKLLAGYRHGDGMELGMVNPQWGYWGPQWSRLAPTHPLFGFFNQMAWGTEVVAAVLMLIPQTRFIGGAMILLSFIFIATQIRLGFLCEMVIVCCLVFFHPGSAGDVLIAGLLPSATAPGVTLVSPWMSRILWTALWGYVILLPFARFGQSYNMFAKKALPGAMQALLDFYTNVFGLILWRVFSADHTNFLIRIYELKASGQRSLLSAWDEHRRFFARFNQVGEAIVVTTLFTALKYYPSNNAIFVDRILRYARTLPKQQDSRFVFEHVTVAKNADGFELRPAAEFTVDVAANTVTDVTLDPTRSVRAPVKGSPLHEGTRPGSYVPLKS